jgi:hypothetical protein
MKPASVCFASLRVLLFSRFALSDSKPNAARPPARESNPPDPTSRTWEMIQGKGGPTELPEPASPPKDPVWFLARFG